MNMITAENFIHHEFIGLEVLVLASSNPFLTSIFGRIINETKQMLVIQPYDGALSKHHPKERPKMVAKKGSVFRFTLPDGGLVDVDGDAICTAPHRRIGMRGVKVGVSCIGLKDFDTSDMKKHVTTVTHRGIIISCGV